MDALLNQNARVHLCILTATLDPAAALPLAAWGLRLSRVANDIMSESEFLRCQGYSHDRLGNIEAAAQANELAAKYSGRNQVVEK